MDSWRNGGLVEGVPATDEFVLGYWRKRLEGISPKDPLYDQYSNTIMQFEYAVAESKSATLYAQGKITAQQRGQFFLDWAKKVPPDTEFYRTLQRNAAQFVEQVKSTARAAGTSSRRAASVQADTVTSNNYEVTGKYVTDMLTQFARDNGFIGRTEDLSKLSFGTRDGAGRMLELIDRLNTERPEWVAQIQAQLDPSFSGTLTYDYYQQALTKQADGLRLRYQRAVAEGRMGTVDGQPGATALKTQMDNLTELNAQSGMYDSAQAYLEIRKNFTAVWQDGTASPAEKVKAWSVYRDGLLGIANDAGNPVDAETAAALVAEANLDPSVDSWFENFTRNTSVGASTTSGDNAETRQDVERFLAEYAAVNDGTGQTVWTYGERKADGTFEARAGGSVVGATSAVRAAQAGAKAVAIPQNDGTTLTVYVAPVDVTAVARGADGNPLPVAEDAAGDKLSNKVGTALDVWVGGNLVRVYGYTAGDGTTRYTTVPPWGGGVTEFQNPDGSITVDVTAAVAAGQGSAATGGFVPQQASEDAIRSNAGINERTDFVSPMMAAMEATPGGKDQLGNLANDPQLRSVIEQDALTFLMTADGRIDVPAWQAFTAQLDRWSRPAQTKDEYYSNTDNTPAFRGEPSVPTVASPLLADAGLAGSPVAPLADAMSAPGRLKGFVAARPPGVGFVPAIKPATQLTVPQLPASGYVTAPAWQQGQPPLPQGVTNVPPPPAPWVGNPLPQGVTNVPKPAPAPLYTTPFEQAITLPPVTQPGYQPTFEELAAGWRPS